MKVNFTISVEVGDDWETFELWEIWLRSASRARTQWAAGIKDRNIAPYALMVELGTQDMPARPLFGMSFDEMAGELNVNDFINKHLDSAGRGNPPGLHAIPSFMDPLCDALGQDFVDRAKKMQGFAPNSEKWAQEKGHRRPWVGRQGRDRMIHDILWPHALDSLFVWKLRSKRGSAGKPRKSRSKGDKEIVHRPKAARRARTSLTAGSVLGAVGKGLSSGGRGGGRSGGKFKMKMPKMNMDSQRFLSVGKSQSKKATNTRFKPQGAKGRKYSYNRPYGA